MVFSKYSRLIPATSIIIYLLKKGVIKKEEAKKYIGNLGDMVSEEEYHLAMDEVKNDN